MSNPQDEQPDEAGTTPEAPAQELEDGPSSASKPRPPAIPEGAMSVTEAQQRCAAAIHALCEQYGMRIYTRISPREVAGGSYLMDATWGLTPNQQPHAH